MLLPPAIAVSVFGWLNHGVMPLFDLLTATRQSFFGRYSSLYQYGPPHRPLIELFTLAPWVFALLPIVVVAAFGGAFQNASSSEAGDCMRANEARRRAQALVLVFSFIGVVFLVLPKNVRFYAVLDPLAALLVAWCACEAMPWSRALTLGWWSAILLCHAAFELALFHRTFVVSAVTDPTANAMFRALQIVPGEGAERLWHPPLLVLSCSLLSMCAAWISAYLAEIPARIAHRSRHRFGLRAGPSAVISPFQDNHWHRCGPAQGWVMTKRGDAEPSAQLRLGVFSRGLLELEAIRTVLGTDSIVFRPTAREASTLDAIIGWGHKPTAHIARQYSQNHGLPYWAIEDGFLRSVDLGPKCPPLSLIVDERGIYYDATGPSTLEEMLAATRGSDVLTDPLLLERSRKCRERIIQARLSKYNHAPDEVPAELVQAKRPIVLVVDQTWGDAAVDLGGAGSQRFSEMVTAACLENPEATIVVKTHPDTIAGKKRGYLNRQALPAHTRLLATAVNPQVMLALVDHVYVCTSQLGFEALMLKKKVTCFGLPFYSGWGLTDDRIACVRRNRRRSLDELVAAALILYPKYVHPFSGELTQIESVIEHLALQRSRFAENSGRIACVGVSMWKRPFVRRYLRSPGNEVRFSRRSSHSKRLWIQDPLAY